MMETGKKEEQQQQAKLSISSTDAKNLETGKASLEKYY